MIGGKCGRWVSTGRHGSLPNASIRANALAFATWVAAKPGTTSCHCNGIETGAAGIGRTKKAEAINWPGAFWPQSRNTLPPRAYRLLSEAMLVTELVRLTTYSARGKQYIVLVRPFQGCLMMHQLRHADEIKAWSEVPIGDLPEVKPSELNLAKQIIQQIASDSFVPEKYKDDVRVRMMDLINKKVEGQEITAMPEAPQGKVIDLMEALKASLGMSDGGHKPMVAAPPTAAASTAEVIELAAVPVKKSRKKAV